MNTKKKKKKKKKKFVTDLLSKKSFQIWQSFSFFYSSKVMIREIIIFEMLVKKWKLIRILNKGLLNDFNKIKLLNKLSGKFVTPFRVYYCSKRERGLH
jgi:hypothetical protein